MIPLWLLFLISHLTSWPARSLSTVNIKIRKLLLYFFATALTVLICKSQYKDLGHSPSFHLHEISQMLLLLGYVLVTDYFPQEVVSQRETLQNKRFVCFFPSNVSADNHRGRRVMDFYRRGAAILYHPPAVCNTWWNHAVETLEESVYSALEGTGGGEKKNKKKGGRLKAGD